MGTQERYARKLTAGFIDKFAKIVKIPKEWKYVMIQGITNSDSYGCGMLPREYKTYIREITNCNEPFTVDRYSNEMMVKTNNNSIEFTIWKLDPDEYDSEDLNDGRYIFVIE